MTACNYLPLLVFAVLFLGSSWTVEADIGGVPATQTSSGTATTGSEVTPVTKSAKNQSSRHKKKKTAIAGTATSSGKKAVVSKATATVAMPGKKVAAGSGLPATGAKKLVTATGAAPGAASAPAVLSAKHKKAHSKHAVASGKAVQPAVAPAGGGSGAITIYSPLNPTTSSLNPPPPPLTVTKSPGDSHSEITMSAPAASLPHSPASAGPEVETGLPVARHGGYDPSEPSTDSHGTVYQIGNTIPVPAASTLIGSYTPPRSRVKNSLDNFTFTNFSRHVRNIYPWKINIFTTKFWIGEGSTPISSTTNVASAWDEDWRSNNGGTDTPDDRQGYMPANHAARENPFYIALPFNDLAFPDKARRWLPSGWYLPPKNGKQVSACKDRWVEIKNAQGETCYAQWEDVGPLRYDHAEYVFGDEKPDTYTSGGLDRAGLDVSPAVADYLNITGKNCMTRWRFVDAADVVPGRWLQYDEEAVIFRAMHALKEDPTRVLPIQRATAPIDDEEDLDSAKKRIGAAKG